MKIFLLYKPYSLICAFINIQHLRVKTIGRGENKEFKLTIIGTNRKNF
uniref:Uncharacterized protein n=1 Tax=Rhizophora mucronata TaxID=61149 RepID=A0A2P2N861_RHIMU